MNLLGPELLVVLVVIGALIGIGTMLLTMTTMRRRNRLRQSTSADVGDDPLRRRVG